MSQPVATSTPATNQNGPPRAVLYLRVSTPGQVKTDYDPEGISIPAQRKACVRKASQMGALIIDEYIEPGRSAREMAKRPVFQAMLGRIRDQRDVQYVIVYKLSRMNRNRFDDAFVVMELKRYGAILVSATENFDDTPVGRAMHGMTAVFNEFRSAEDGEDIRYKMGEKAKRGGTLGRAKLGYLNVRETLEDGREVRTVTIDPERGQFITLAFELFATGDYTLETLQDTLTDRGLRTRPGRHPAGPVSISKLASMLRDRYYLGYVTYQGIEYQGRHQPLVTPELFERVQLVLDAKASAGERPRVHHHYLKGSLWCWRCHSEDGRESRMIVNKAKGNGGEYFYFFCRARHDHACSTPYWDREEVEDAVLRHYTHVRLEPEFARLVRTQLQDSLADRDQATKLLEQQLTIQLARLDRQEENLLDLAADGDLPQAKIRQRLHRIAEQRERLQAQKADTDTQIDIGAALLEAALDLLGQPQELYRQSDDQGRRLLNQAIFERLYVGPHGIEGDVIREPFRDLITVQRAEQGGQIIDLRQADRNEQEATDVASCESLADLLVTAIHSDGGWNRAVMVDHPGVEPLHVLERQPYGAPVAEHMDVAPAPDERFQVDLVLVDQALLGEAVRELAAPVHEQVTVDLVLQPRDRVPEVPRQQGRVPLEVSGQAVRPDVLGQRIEHVRPLAGLTGPVPGQPLVGLAAQHQPA